MLHRHQPSASFISCSVCPLGNYGGNCELICLDGLYGLFCSKACQCSSSECDKVYGCLKRGNERDEEYYSTCSM